MPSGGPHLPGEDRSGKLLLRAMRFLYFILLFYLFTYQCAKLQELDNVLPQLECGEIGCPLCWWEGIPM